MAEKWGIKERRINTLCLEGRIEGTVKFGNTWAIPKDVEKPKDERIKSGKYISKKMNDIMCQGRDVKSNYLDEISKGGNCVGKRKETRLCK